MPAPFLTLILLLAAEAALWAASRRLKDVTIADIFWGPGFILAAAVSATAAPPTDARNLLLLALVAIWAMRLTGHLFFRWRHAGQEDRRYAAMRATYGSAFEQRSLFIVFLAQGIAVWIVSWPLQAAMAAPPVAFGWLDLTGALIAAAGFALEAVADWQLAHFLERPDNRGKVLAGGVWAWSRHPNYFGDVAFWWGIFLIALAGSGAWWSVLGPLLMTFVLLRVSGVPLTEKDIVRRRPAYTDYMRRTSAFIPRRPLR